MTWKIIFVKHEQNTKEVKLCEEDIMICNSPMYMLFKETYNWYNDYIDGLAQDCSISSALVMDILRSCTKPSICLIPLRNDKSSDTFENISGHDEFDITVKVISRPQRPTECGYDDYYWQLV